MRVASVEVGRCPSCFPTNPLLRPPEPRAAPNWPELALIRSTSVDAPSIVTASGEHRQIASSCLPRQDCERGAGFRETNLPENRGRLIRGSEFAKGEVLILIAGDDDGKVHGEKK